MSAPLPTPLRVKRHLKVADQVAEALLELMRQGTFKMGERLPPERELALQLGVSRASLRDALRRLELLGYLATRQGDGSYVSLPGGEQLALPFRSVLQDQPQTAHDLLEFRALLEPEVAALAAQRLTPEFECALRASLQRQAQLVSRGETLVREDVAFHDVLARAAGNAVVLQVLDTLSALLRDLRLVALPAALLEHTLQAHTQVAQAIFERDPMAARAAMQRHLRDVSDTFRAAQASDAFDIHMPGAPPGEVAPIPAAPTPVSPTSLGLLKEQPHE